MCLFIALAFTSIAATSVQAEVFVDQLELKVFQNEDGTYQYTLCISNSYFQSEEIAFGNLPALENPKVELTISDSLYPEYRIYVNGVLIYPSIYKNKDGIVFGVSSFPAKGNMMVKVTSNVENLSLQKETRNGDEKDSISGDFDADMEKPELTSRIYAAEKAEEKAAVAEKAATEGTVKIVDSASIKTVGIVNLPESTVFDQVIIASADKVNVPASTVVNHLFLVSANTQLGDIAGTVRNMQVNADNTGVCSQLKIGTLPSSIVRADAITAAAAWDLQCVWNADDRATEIRKTSTKEEPVGETLQIRTSAQQLPSVIPSVVSEDIGGID